jgi:1-acyl-sn-glycerol-3-phosphate acyltransferase
MPTLDVARSGARAVGMGAFTLSMLAGVRVHQHFVTEAAQRPVFDRWMQRWADGLLDLFGVQARWHGQLPGPACGARLVVSNHRSPLDILLLLSRFGGVVLSRADLAQWPVIGFAAQRAETIFVDRADAVSGVLAIRALRDRLTKLRTVIVFPEGTTVAGDEVQPFQQGAFVAARGLPVEIVPIGIAYPPGCEFTDDTFYAHVARVARRKRTPVSCVVGVPSAMPETRKGTSEMMRAEIQGLVHQARSHFEVERIATGDTAT